MAERFKVLWLQAGGCGGCTMAALDRGDWFAELAALGIDLLWHPSLSEATGVEAREILDAVATGAQPLDALVLEGAVLRGPAGTGLAQRLAGTGRTMLDWVTAIAPRAEYCVAVGSCAAYGGIPAGEPNPVEATGLQFEKDEPSGVLGREFRSKKGLPVVNIAGCAPHPGWIMETLAALAAGLLTADQLDGFGRPRFYADHLAHHGCSRNEFYEFKASAGALGRRGCLMEHLGCKATQSVGDCNQRVWNGGGACTHAGYPCVDCTAPGFEDIRRFAETPKVAGIPVGLPLDMPKAWFIALAALSKSATPRRVRDNAAADHLLVPPRKKPRKGR